MQTSTANIYALGDIVKDTPQLAHVAFAEAITAVTHIATGEKSPVNYSAIPYVVYTNPELAEVGTNSDKAKVNELMFPSLSIVCRRGKGFNTKPKPRNR